MKRHLNRLRSRTAAFTHDLLVIPLAWLGAYWLRFNLQTIPDPFWSLGLAVLPIVVAIQGFIFWYFGLYRGVWRYASIPDLVRIVKAVFVGCAVLAAGLFLLTRMVDFPRSVFPLYGLLLVLLLSGSRLAYRWLRERHLLAVADKRVLIVGAGSAGEMLARDLLRDRGEGYKPVAFLDDDRAKKGKEIHGLRVRGACARLPKTVEELAVDVVLIAIPSANSGQMRAIVDLCEQSSVEFRTLPGLGDIVSGRSTVSALREVSIEDLLGREPVSLNWNAIRDGINGKRILVTGGGGSIGSELCRQIARLAPRMLVVLDQSELNVYSIERDLRAVHAELNLRVVLGDVTDRCAVERVFATYSPDVVFHAAAYKHVPMLENQVRAAARVNVLGTRNVADVAANSGTGAFVLISTDKAVNPTNVMGASKRLAEILTEDRGRRNPGTAFITVRFGNVLDSAGSVVPLFRAQIARGGPVTVTHPEINRYFMTIPEACQLIMQAATSGRGGDVFVLDMGEPVNIAYLAEQMIRLAGKTPGEEVEVVFTGLRPGEKLSEELFHEQEALTATRHEKLLLARHREVDWAAFAQSLTRLEKGVERFDETGILAELTAQVPEFRSATAGDGSNVIHLRP